MIRFEMLPVKIPDLNAFVREVESEMQAEGQDTDRMLKDFVDTWDGKPDTRIKLTSKRNVGLWIIHNWYAGGEGILQILRFVIYGTKPHDITPREDGYPLRFLNPGTFSPKTQPGVIQSSAGNPGGPGVVRTYFVEHPGNAPRGTLAQIQQERRQRFLIRMQTAVNRGVQAAHDRGKIVK